MSKTQVLGALLVASGPLNSYMKMTELWAKNHMPIFGHSHQIWLILAHKLVKYQYFWMKPTLYEEKKLAAKFWKMPGKFQNLAAKFFKGLTQNFNTKLKVMRRFYVDSENFM